MKLRYLALAAALAISTPAFAVAPVSTLNETTDSALQGPEANFLGESYINPNPSTIDTLSQSKSSSFAIAATGMYSFWMAALSSVDTNTTKPSSGLFYASLKDSAGSLIKEINIRVSGSTPYFARYWSDLELTAGTYTVYIEGAHLTSGNGETAAAAGVRAGNTTVAVPGPEAGAGLGALALGGMAIWIGRRRKDIAPL